jgi:hypothetical protein
MSFAGYNFDVFTGLAALLILGASYFWRIPRALGWAFNALGSATLLFIVSIALLSLPVFGLFGADKLNTWVAHAPYITLPTVMVQLALFGHIVLGRKLRVSASNSLRHGVVETGSDHDAQRLEHGTGAEVLHALQETRSDLKAARN